MRRFLKATFVLALWAAPLSAQETFLFSPPAGFELSAEKSNADILVREYLQGDAVPWRSRALSTYAHKLKNIPPRHYAARIMATESRKCARADTEIGYEGTQNGYDTVILIVTCPASDLGADVPETAFIKILSGETGTFTAQIAWRGEIADETRTAFMQWTVPQRLCNRARPRSPCPTDG